MPVSPALAQDGTAPLVLPVNPRTGAMALAGTADNSDPSSIYLNPANVVATPHAYLSGSTLRLSFDDFLGGDAPEIKARRFDGGGAWQLDATSAWTFGASITYGDVEWTSDLFEGLDDVSEHVVSLALGAGFAMDGRYEFRLGAAVKRISATVPYFVFDPFFGLASGDVDGYAYDAGFAAALRGDETQWHVTPQFGIAVTNGGPEDLELPDGSFQALPTSFNVGASFRIASPMSKVGDADAPLFAATINLDGQDPEEGSLYWAFGSEIALAQTLFIRGGVQMVTDETLPAWGVGFGLPVASFRFRFDYCDADSEVARDNVSLLLEWLF
jgi:hypothetical protein